MDTATFRKKIILFTVIVIIAAVFGLAAGGLSGFYFYKKVQTDLTNLKLPPQERIIQQERVVKKEYVPQTSQEQVIINVVKEASPSVVSIIITKDLPVLEQYGFNPFEEFFGSDPFFQFNIPQYQQKGTQKQEVGGGSGFIISKDGMVLTNKHVVLDEEAEYTVLTNDGKRYPAKVLARDPFQDLAILKMENGNAVFQPVKLGDAANLQVGQTVIAIGNALGEFRNTVSVGVVSGLMRSVTAGGGGFTETIEDVIQTDAAINPGNSGGPLFNLAGEVIGVNTATALGAENIGFAIPIDKAKRDINQVLKNGKITYAFLGVCWQQVTPDLQKKMNLSVDYGALIAKSSDCPYGVFSDSPAQKAGLKTGDIILEWNSRKLTADNSLGKVVQDYNPGDKVKLKFLRDGQEKIIDVVLGERSE